MKGEPPLQKSSDLEDLECPNGLDSSSGSGEDSGDEEVESINDDSTASKPPRSKLFGQVKRPAVKSPEDPDGLKKKKKKTKKDKTDGTDKNIGKESLRQFGKQSGKPSNE